MRALATILLGTTIVACAASAHADVSIGANFGGGVHFPKRRDTEVYAAWPAQGPYFTPLPGIRFGFTGGTGAHEGYVDSSAAIFGDDRLRWVLATANYQYAFTPLSEKTAYLTFGGGLLYRGVQNDGTAGGVLGAGFGMRQRVSRGYGTFRGELRVDWVPRASAYGETITVWAKLGFDLWFR